MHTACSARACESEVTLRRASGCDCRSSFSSRMASSGCVHTSTVERSAYTSEGPCGRARSCVVKR
eukprot:6180249-Pleurochrysis_carterae.AAC.1